MAYINIISLSGFNRCCKSNQIIIFDMKLKFDLEPSKCVPKFLSVISYKHVVVFLILVLFIFISKLSYIFIYFIGYLMCFSTVEVITGRQTGHVTHLTVQFCVQYISFGIQSQKLGVQCSRFFSKLDHTGFLTLFSSFSFFFFLWCLNDAL